MRAERCVNDFTVYVMRRAANGFLLLLVYWPPINGWANKTFVCFLRRLFYTATTQMVYFFSDAFNDAPAIPIAQAASTPVQRLALAARLWDWHPHDGQRELLTQTLDGGREPKVLIAVCGRRWGKTEALSMDIAARILLDPDLGQMGVAPTRDQAETLFEAVLEKIETAQENEAALAEFPHLATLQTRLSPYPHFRRKDTGAVVFSARTAGRSGRGLRGKGTTRKLSRFRVIVDERAFVPDDAVERALLPMLATVPHGGGQLVAISSPNGKRGGFYKQFLRGEAEGQAGIGTHRAVRLPSSQNPLVDTAFLDEMRETMSASAFRAEFEAEFVDSAGAVFPQDDVQAAVCDDDYGAAPLWGATYVAGVDFGRRADWTVVIVCAVTTVKGASDDAQNEPRPGLRVVALQRLRGLTWSAQVERVAEILQTWNVQTVACDQTGVGDAVTEELQRALQKVRSKTRVDGFTFTSASKAGIIDRLSLLLSQKRMQFPPHPDLLGELSHFTATPRASGNGERLEAASGSHDDCVCALALAVHAGSERLALANPLRRAFGAKKQNEKEWDFSCGGEIRERQRADEVKATFYRILDGAYQNCAPVRAAGAAWLAFQLKRRRRSGRAKTERTARPAA